MSTVRSAVDCLVSRAGYAAIFGVVLALVAQTPTAVLRAQNPQTSPVVEANCLGFGAARTERQAATGTVRFIGTESGRPISNPAGASDSPLGAARSYLSACGSLFGLDQPNRDMQVTETKAVDVGRSVVRFRQTHQGVPVLAGELIVQVDAKGNIVTVAGETLPQPVVDTTPTITSDQASQIAIEVVVKNYSVDPGDVRTSAPELWIYSPALLGPGTGPASLVWRMDVTTQALSPVRELVLIDAQRASVRLHFNQTHTARDRRTYTALNTTLLPGILVCDESNPMCAGGDSHAVGAHVGARETYDFYATIHGRDSVNNLGMTLESTVHYGLFYDNAFWDGTRGQMVYGDWYGFALADDVVGHELTHGVTQHTSNLFHYYQSGAINESLSDIWGEFIDLTNGRGTDTPGARWLMGEDISGLGAIRNMANPPAYSDPDRIGSPLYYEGSADGGGVHTNSGVNNKAAFLMVDGGVFNTQTVTGLGITKVAKIYYEVQTNLLTSGSDYADLYDALFQGCTNLVGISGITGADCQEVRDATNAVEMNLQPAPNFNADAPLCAVGGHVPSNVFFDDMESGAANWNTNNASRWYQVIGYAHSEEMSRYGDDSPSFVSDSNTSMVNGVTIPPNAYLHFAHAYGFEGPFWDGGVVEYTIDGGSTWNDAGPLFEVNGYDGQISGVTNPLYGRQAFLDDSHGYISSRLNLTSVAGQTVRFRWRMGLDVIFSDLGWVIDDVRIYTCGPAQLTVTSLTANTGFPVPIGTPVTWTAAADGGTTPYSYKFWVYDGFTWTVGQDWSASNTWTWTPTISSTYRVQVWVRNAGSSAVYDAWREAGPFTVSTPPLGVSSLTANPPCPASTNTAVTWTALVSGGTGPYSYKFWVYDGSTWSVSQDWTPNRNTWIWAPRVAGTYVVQVWVRNAGSLATYDAWLQSASCVVNDPLPLTVTSFTANQVFPIPQGTPVNWTATASGGTGQYTYKLWIYNGTIWTVGRDWGASNAFTWTPASQGTYFFQVWARNAGSSAAYDAFRQYGPYDVTAPAPITATSLFPDRVFPVPAGTPVTWTGLARGGTAPYSYQFWVYNGSSWSVGQAWSSSPTWTWVPPTPGTYQFQLWVRNAGSANPFDTYVVAGPATIGVSAPLSATLSVTSAASIQVGTPTTLAAFATGGLGPYTYKFWVHNGTSWSVGQDWSTASTFNWIPLTIGPHTFQVWVRNAGSVTPLDASAALGLTVPSSFGVAVSPSGTGLSNATNFQFTAYGFNNVVRYTWDFGDGTTISGPAPSAAHVYTRSGLFWPALEMMDNTGARTAVTPQPITVGSVSGTWDMTLVPNPAYPYLYCTTFTVVLEQTGSEIRGTITPTTCQPRPDGAVVVGTPFPIYFGSVSNPRNAYFGNESPGYTDHDDIYWTAIVNEGLGFMSGPCTTNRCLMMSAVRR